MHLTRQIGDVIVFVKTINLHKLINGFLLRVSRFVTIYTPLYVHWGSPESLSVEPVNLCNLHCPECVLGNNTLSRSTVFMSFLTFKTIIDSNSKTLSYLQLFFQGEPFLHSDIFNFINYATGKRIYTSISTNGHFLNNDNCIKIVESGLQRIIISVDGTTQDVYEKYRQGGNLNKVLLGIKELVSVRDTMESKTPYVVMQFVVFSTNEHQIEDIKQLSVELGVDKLSIKSAMIEDFADGNVLIPKKSKISRYIKTVDGHYVLNREKNFKCRRVWFNPVISSAGEVLPCCFDKDGKYSFGEFENEINSVWKGKKGELFRKQVFSRSETIDICSNCTEGLIMRE